mgnify:FL=1
MYNPYLGRQRTNFTLRYIDCLYEIEIKMFIKIPLIARHVAHYCLGPPNLIAHVQKSVSIQWTK